MKLIEEARQAWRFASVRLAVLAGFVSGWAATDPQGFAQVMEMIPAPARPLVGVLVTASAVYTRLIRQGEKTNG